MRAKIPQLKDALQSRFTIEHHGIMVAQLLAHIDTLDAALQNLSERIEFVLAPHAQIIELLCTIPGVQAHAAQVLIAECGLDMTVFPTVGHFASWAGACPGHHESAGRRRSGRTRPGPALADLAAHRMRPRRGPHQGHLPRRALRAAPRAPRRTESDRRDPPRPARRLLPHRPRPSPIPGSRTRLATQALLRRAPRPTSAAPTRSARLRRHPRPSRTTARRTSRLTLRTSRAGLPPTDRRRERLRPKRGRNSGIHRTASL